MKSAQKLFQSSRQPGNSRPGRRRKALCPGAICLEILEPRQLLSGTGELLETQADSVEDDGQFAQHEVTIVELADGSFVGRPSGPGPFPVLLYNHGGLGTQVGGDLRGTCSELAEAGFLVRAEKRPETVSLDGHLDDVLQGLDALLSDPDADPSRVGIMGFSRGGLLSLQAAIARPDDIHSVVLMAPAPGQDQLAETLQDVSALSAPVSIYVAENDVNGANHVQICQDVVEALEAAGKEVELTVYPPFADDGHSLFFEVREPYISDVTQFFDSTLCADDNGGLAFEFVDATGLDYGQIWSVPVHDGQNLVVSSEGGGFLRAAAFDESLTQIGDAVLLAGPSDTDNGAGIADHKHLFQDGHHYIAFSVTTADGLYLLQLDQDLQRERLVRVETGDSPTNDMFLVGDGSRVSVGVFQPGNGHTVSVFDNELNLESSLEIGGGQNRHANGASAIHIDGQFHVVAPQTLAPGEGDAFYQLTFDANWEVIESRKTILEDPGVLGIVSGLSFEPQSRSFVVHYTRSADDGGGDLMRAVYTEDWQLSGHELVREGTFQRPHTVIHGQDMYLGLEDASASNGQVVQVAHFRLSTSRESTPLNFVPDAGMRLTDASVPEVGIDPETGTVYLYASDGPDKYLATSTDGGLEFSEKQTPENHAFDPRGMRMPEPDETGRTIWRQFCWNSEQGIFESTISYDGVSYQPEDGVRFDPPQTEVVGVYTHFVTSDGRVGLMYIGDKGTTDANVRLAYSSDNGQTFEVFDDNPLGDRGTHDDGLNQRDPTANVMPDGSIRIFTMVQGGPDAPLPGQRVVTEIQSFVSWDDGLTFTHDSEFLLRPEDFSEFHVWSLNDPSVILLPDGGLRLYIAGLITDTADGADPYWAILSATSESSVGEPPPDREPPPDQQPPPEQPDPNDLARLAYDLDQRLDLDTTGNLFEDWGGRGEKWLLGGGADWYFITPDGALVEWDGVSGASGETVAQLSSAYHADPSLLYDAQPVEGSDESLEFFSDFDAGLLDV